MERRAAGLLDGRRELFLKMLRVLAAMTVVGALIATQLRVQTATPQSPSPTTTRTEFEVASIKPDKSGGPFQGLKVEPGGRVTAHNVSVRYLVSSAYRLTPAQIRMISGAPAWIDSERFDLEAKAEGNFSEDQLVLMAQSLLADRFKLKAHTETKQLPVYALVLASAGKTGPHLAPHTADAKCDPDPRGGGEPINANSVIPRAPCGGIRFLIDGGRMGVGASTTMNVFARNISGLVDRAVVDRTGLSGDYDLALEFTPAPGQPGSIPDVDANVVDSTAPPDIFRAIQEQLGLKLERETGPVDILVIDHIEELSAN